MYNTLARRCDGMVDVTDSKSVGGDTVWVRVPPLAPKSLQPFGCGDFAVSGGVKDFCGWTTAGRGNSADGGWLQK